MKIVINVKDLQKADCRVEFIDQTDEDGDMYHRAVVTLNETGQSFWIDADAAHTVLTSEYREGGSNRAVIAPKVAKANIPHKVTQ